ncbi:MAG: thiamine pyrophosphate-requiring protein [Pseudomonadota bacterium]
MNGADIVAAALKAEGVEIIPSFPFHEVIESASKIGIRPIIVRQERQALHIADGYARVTGGRKVAATAVQSGPGAENAFGGVAQCYGDNVPVVHLAEGYSYAEQWLDPNFSSLVALQSISKHCTFVPTAERLPLAVSNAFSQVRNGKPGPVVLEMPEDILANPAPTDLLEDYPVSQRLVTFPDPTMVSQIAKLLQGANNPVIVAGQGVLYSGASEALVQLAEKLTIPVLSTLNGKSAFPEEHPLYLGCGGQSQSDAIIEFLKTADVICGIGTSFTESSYITPYPRKGRTYIQVTNCEADISKGYPIKWPLISDARAAILAITELVSPAGSARESVIPKIANLQEEFQSKWQPLLTSDETPITPYRVISELMNTIDREKSVVTHDAGAPRDQITPFYRSLIPHGYMGWGKTTQLGLGLGLVQGAKLARPDFTCVNIMGDAAIGMVGMDFETSVREKIPTTTIMLNNGIMGLYSSKLPEASKEYEVNHLGGNYTDLAKSLGGHAERVVDPVEISSALKRAFQKNEEGEAALVEVITREETRIPYHPDRDLLRKS